MSCLVSLADARAAEGRGGAESSREPTPRVRLLGKVPCPWGALPAFAPDGRKLLVAAEEEVRVWDATTLKPVMGPVRHGAAIRTADFSRDGRAILTAGGRLLRLWDARTGEGGLRIELGHAVRSAALSPDGSMIASASPDDPVVRLWDAGTGAPRRSLEHPAPVRHLAFSPAGDRLLTVTDENPKDGIAKEAGSGVRVWDLAKGKVVMNHGVMDIASTMIMHEGRPSAFSPDGTRVATIYVGFVTVREFGKDKPVADIETGDDFGEAAAVRFSPAGDLIATGGVGGAQVWDVATSKPIGRGLPHGPTCAVHDVLFTPDARLLILAATGEAGGVWDWRSGRQLASFVDAGYASAPTPAIACSPQGDRIAVAYPNEGFTAVSGISK